MTIAEASHRTALAGLLLYAAFAPHSVAASAIAIGLAGGGWLFRTVASRSLGLARTKFDLIILCLLIWTIISSVLSVEPLISIAKIKASWCVFIFYLMRAILTRRTALLVVALLITSGAVGALYSLYDIARGRGVLISAITSTSPFKSVGVEANDTIWRVGKTRVYSTSDIDVALHSLAPESVVSVSIISRGEHVERQGLKGGPNVDSGIVGAGRTHRFRASGWTRHYETFAELLQMIAQLALGLALAHLRNHGFNRTFRVALPATLLLVVGIVLTAMRTLVVAFIASAFVIAWRSTRLASRVVVTFSLFFLLAFGAVVVWQTRAPTALLLGDDSSSLRSQVAKVGLSRILVHPVFGHGMDAMHKHWHEWGFPGNDMLHLHSTPLQLAFDRGLPMLAFWLWLMISFWIYIARVEKISRNQSDTYSYGMLLGILGALTGFLISSLVNYNYGDSEVVMLFWSLMGIALVIGEKHEELNVKLNEE